MLAGSHIAAHEQQRILVAVTRAGVGSRLLRYGSNGGLALRQLGLCRIVPLAVVRAVAVQVLDKCLEIVDCLGVFALNGGFHDNVVALVKLGSVDARNNLTCPIGLVGACIVDPILTSPVGKVVAHKVAIEDAEHVVVGPKPSTTRPRLHRGKCKQAKDDIFFHNR